MPQNQVCLFFYVDGRFLVHGCSLELAENFGDFLVYPHSHFELWETHYAARYGVDFDYYPRGRVAYRKSDNTFLLYHDRCIDTEIGPLLTRYEYPVRIAYDEHYQCHSCNPEYMT